MQTLDETVISQYANDPVTDALVASFGQAVNPDYLFDMFYNLIWNALAQYNPFIDWNSTSGYGLDVWGRIVGIGRILQVPVGSYFGFQEATDRTGFNQSPFYAGQPLTENYALTNEAYLRLILAKAAANITGDSIPEINQILMNLFPNRGNAYVADGSSFSISTFGFAEAGDRTGFNQAPFGDFLYPTLLARMTIVYTFDFVLQPFEIAIVETSGVLPTPTGVIATASYLT